MEYTALKAAHAGFAYLSIILFSLRYGVLQWRGPDRPIKILNILPHVVNTGLIVLAVLLCLQLQQYPLTSAWVTAKFIGLLVYIGLGTVAVKRQSHVAFGLTLVCLVYLVGVAKFHSVFSWLATA